MMEQRTSAQDREPDHPGLGLASLQRWVLRLLALILFVSATAGSSQPAQRRVIVPKASWIPIYFATIDSLAARIGLTPLRILPMRPGDIEFRMWEGFGIGGERGFVFRRHGARWSALAVEKRPYRKARRLNVAKTVDWAAVWEGLRRDGIEDIKDTSESPSCTTVNDGIGYVMELATEDRYQTYLVSNPESERSESGDHFLALLPHIYRAFGVESHVDVSALPRGETRVVASISTGLPASGGGLGPGERVFTNRQAVKQIDLPSDEAYRLGIDLRGPRCDELPSPTRSLRITGDVPVAVVIDPSGLVLGAKAADGPFMLQAPTALFALRWRFAPSSGNEMRNAVITVEYREAWVPFPWLK
jgi:hypothetical protein